ncbi:MAG: aldo/keto reductase [Clostridia bacterium]|nr:aldo/keto reductase [Clostridia bacterium]
MKYSSAFGKLSSRIILGSAYFGTAIREDEAFELIDKYVDLGGCHIDTARMYSNGESEKIIGKWIKNNKSKDVLISSKGGFPDREQKSRLTKSELEYDLNKSLDALNVDCIDFYWLHRDDEKISAGEIIDIMNDFVKVGKIRRFGASNWRSNRIIEANTYAKRKGLYGFEGSQIRFSVAKTSPSFCGDPTLVEMNGTEFEFYKNANIPVAAFASQAKGFFSKIDQSGVEGLSKTAKQRYLCKENIDKFEYVKVLAKKYEKSVGAIVCGALCSFKIPEVFPIIGVRTKLQLEDSMNGGDVELSQSEIKRLFGEKFLKI